VRRHGVEDIKGKMPLVSEPPKQPRRKLSEGELRQQSQRCQLRPTGKWPPHELSRVK